MGWGKPLKHLAAMLHIDMRSSERTHGHYKLAWSTNLWRELYKEIPTLGAMCTQCKAK